MKSLFRSLTQLQRAFEKSPYKSIDYFLEILLFTKVDVPKDVPNQNIPKTSNLQTLQNLQSLQKRAALKKTEVKTRVIHAKFCIRNMWKHVKASATQ